LENGKKNQFYFKFWNLYQFSITQKIAIGVNILQFRENRSFLERVLRKQYRNLICSQKNLKY